MEKVREMNEAIQLINLTKKYEERTVVQNVNLTIHEGEIFGLLGVNGAGKTTVIKMLSGLIRPTSGDAIVLEKSILSQMNEIKKDIGVSPQETAIAPNLTVRENLDFMAGIHGLKGETKKKKVEKLITEFSLVPYEKMKSKKLSGGWQRKLSIAMALISEPKILFLDEPTLGLDILSRRELWKLIHKLKETTTIILTTHYLEEAEELCNRICIMKTGRILAVGTSEELKLQTNTQTFDDAFVKVIEEEN